MIDFVGAGGPQGPANAGVMASDSNPVQAALLASLRGVLGRLVQAERLGKVSDASAGAALRAVCADARRLRIPITRLLLTLKSAWHSLPAQGRASWLDTDAILARVVTSCIREYYSPAADASGRARKAAPAHRRGDAPRWG